MRGVIILILVSALVGVGAALAFQSHMDAVERSAKCIDGILYYPRGGGWVADAPPHACKTEPK